MAERRIDQLVFALRHKDVDLYEEIQTLNAEEADTLSVRDWLERVNLKRT